MRRDVESGHEGGGAHAEIYVQQIYMKIAQKATHLEKKDAVALMIPPNPLSGYGFISPTHKRAEGRAPVWGSEFTSKRRRTTGGIQQKPL